MDDLWMISYNYLWIYKDLKTINSYLLYKKKINKESKRKKKKNKASSHSEDLASSLYIEW